MSKDSNGRNLTNRIKNQPKRGVTPKPSKDANGKKREPWEFLKDSNDRIVTNIKKARQDKLSQQEQKKEQVTRNAIVVDTSVLIQDPNAIDILRAGGANVLFIPLTVQLELDDLKSKTDIGIEAREVSERFETIQLAEMNSMDKSVIRVYQQLWEGLGGLPVEKSDHQILASFNWVLNNRKEFDKIKLVTNDRNMRLLARDLFTDPKVSVEEYYEDKTEATFSWELTEINVPHSIIKFDQKDKSYWFSLEDLSEQDQVKMEKLPFNSGVVCWSDWDGCDDGIVASSDYEKFKPSFAAINQGADLYVVSKEIEALGIKQYSINGNGPNWHQVIALAQLLDPDIKVVILTGGAGTGKTLLAILTALQQHERYSKIMITRPPTHLGDKDHYGFIPGNLNKKMDPYLSPIWQNIQYIKDHGRLNTVEHLKIKAKGIVNDVSDFIDKLIKEEKFVIQALDYIRGQSIDDMIIVVDEAQNLYAREAKAIITRLGKKAKVILTGDLSQIDKQYVDRKSSGLAYAADRLTDKSNAIDPEIAYGPTIVAVTYFKESVRSPIAKYAEKVL